MKNGIIRILFVLIAENIPANVINTKNVRFAGNGLASVKDRLISVLYAGSLPVYARQSLALSAEIFPAHAKKTLLKLNWATVVRLQSRMALNGKKELCMMANSLHSKSLLMFL